MRHDTSLSVDLDWMDLLFLLGQFMHRLMRLGVDLSTALTWMALGGCLAHSWLVRSLCG